MNTSNCATLANIPTLAFLLIACTGNRPESAVPSLKVTFEESEAPKVPKGGDYRTYVQDWLSEKADYVAMNNRIPAAPSKYMIVGDCDGYPRVDVKMAPGFCLGLMDDGEETSMPRWALALDENTIVMTDMGNWNPNQGRIYLLKRGGTGKTWKRSTLFDKTILKGESARLPIIDRANQIGRAPDGRVFVAGAGAIMTFDPLAAKPKETIKAVVAGLPPEGLHPLKSFTFDKSGNLYVNIGSDSNVCQKSGAQGDGAKTCPESEGASDNRGLVRRYEADGAGGFKKAFTVYARGMRNSVALAYDPVLGRVLQGENGRDAIDRFDKNLKGSELPHEELNVLDNGKHFGWPYCYSNNKNNPEWPKKDCKPYEKPAALWPAHSAPLSMLVYGGRMFPAEIYKDALIVALHGYEKYGHRLVVAFRDPQTLRPSRAPLSIAYGWDPKGAQALGSPVGITEMNDGSILVVEDKSKKLLRLFYNPAEGNGMPVDESGAVVEPPPSTSAVELEVRRLRLEEKLRDPNPPAFALFQSKVVDQQCIMCHGGTAFPGIQLLQYDDEGNAARIENSEKAIEVLQRLAGAAGRQMPPQGFATDEQKNEALDLYKDWLIEMKIAVPAELQ